MYFDVPSNYLLAAPTKPYWVKSRLLVGVNSIVTAVQPNTDDQRSNMILVRVAKTHIDVAWTKTVK